MLNRWVFLVVIALFPLSSWASLPSTDYMGEQIAAQIATVVNVNAQTSAPESLKSTIAVSPTQVTGLVDSNTNKVNTTMLPVGTATNTVAAGDDGRFDTIPTTAPATGATPPTGRVFIWFE